MSPRYEPNTKLQLLKLMTQKGDQLCTKEHCYSAEENMNSIATVLQRSQNFLIRKQNSDFSCYCH